MCILYLGSHFVQVGFLKITLVATHREQIHCIVYVHKSYCRIYTLITSGVLAISTYTQGRYNFNVIPSNDNNY